MKQKREQILDDHQEAGKENQMLPAQAAFRDWHFFSFSGFYDLSGCEW